MAGWPARPLQGASHRAFGPAGKKVSRCAIRRNKYFWKVLPMCPV